MLHVSRYGARPAEERKKKMNNSDFRPIQVCYFKIVTTHCYITTADWGKLYKLLDVLLGVSICSPAKILLCKR